MEENPDYLTKYNMIDKLLENQYSSMFQLHNIDGDEDGLTLPQFKEFVYSIGMEFLGHQYNYCEKELFNGTDRVNFSDFIKFLRIESNFTVGPEDYRTALEVMDQEGDGETTDVTDLKRVLQLYGDLDQQEIAKFFQVNLEENK